MTLRVVGAGLGRTGTNSLKLGLERLLGEPCYHMFEVMRHPAHTAVWASAYDGVEPDWDELLDGYAAAVDWPASPFWQPIAEAYPDALILLSVRSADSWWASASTTIFRFMEEQLANPEADENFIAMVTGMMRRFTVDWRDEDAAKVAFNAYNDEVRRTAPADRLLEWRPSDGWEPICERLGLAVPDEPFPQTNSREEIQERLGLSDEA